MPLLLPGSLILGPRSATVPTTMVGYLASLGKNSFYARFLAGQSMTVNSDGTGGAVADGGAVGKWSAYQYNNYAASFIQSTSASRPAYGASRDGKPGIFGNASSWFMSLDSTTANNQSFTLLASGWMVAEAASWVSQNSNNFAVKTVSSLTGPDIAYIGAFPTNTAPQVWRKSASGANNSLRMGITTTSATHYNSVMNLLRRTTGNEYSSSTLHELWIVPPLTVGEIAKALDYLA